MNFGVLVCARMGSSRLSEKMIADVGGKPAIKFLLERIRANVIQEAKIIFCTTHLKEDDILEDISNEVGVSCYRGSVKDKMDRWNQAAKLHNIDYFVNVDGDDLFAEPELINLAFTQYQKEQHDFVRCDESKLVAGIFTFGMKTSALDFLCRNKTELDTEASWLSFYDLDSLNSKMLQNIPDIYYRPEIRATLDYEEDLLFFRSVVNYFGNMGVDFNLRDVLIFLDENPEIANINFFRHKDYLNNQAKLNRKI